MILNVLLLIDESKLLIESNSFVIRIDISIKSLFDGVSDKYTDSIVGVSDRCRYQLKFSLVICIIL